MTAVRSSMVAALGIKALVGGAVVALAAGAAASTAATGSVNPVNWGQHIVQVVEQCKARDTNVGRCVSAIAQEHGEQVRAEHSEAVENGTEGSKQGQRDGQDNGSSPKGDGNGNGAAAGHGQSHDVTAATPSNAAGHGDSSRGHGKPSPAPSSGG